MLMRMAASEPTGAGPTPTKVMLLAPETCALPTNCTVLPLTMAALATDGPSASRPATSAPPARAGIPGVMLQGIFMCALRGVAWLREGGMHGSRAGRGFRPLPTQERNLRFHQDAAPQGRAGGRRPRHASAGTGTTCLRA
jgi:hypothetical protein